MKKFKSPPQNLLYMLLCFVIDIHYDMNNMMCIRLRIRFIYSLTTSTKKKVSQAQTI